MSGSPCWFAKVSILKIFSQMRLWDPRKILIVFCRKLWNTKDRYCFKSQYSDLLLLPLKCRLSDWKGFVGRVMNYWIFCPLEEMIDHARKHSLVGFFLAQYFWWKFLNQTLFTHFPFCFTIRKTCSELFVWIECGSKILGSTYLQSLEFYL